MRPLRFIFYSFIQPRGAIYCLPTNSSQTFANKCGQPIPALEADLFLGFLIADHTADTSRLFLEPHPYQVRPGGQLDLPSIGHDDAAVEMRIERSFIDREYK